MMNGPRPDAEPKGFSRMAIRKPGVTARPSWSTPQGLESPTQAVRAQYGSALLRPAEPLFTCMNDSICERAPQPPPRSSWVLMPQNEVVMEPLNTPAVLAAPANCVLPALTSSRPYICAWAGLNNPPRAVPLMITSVSFFRGYFMVCFVGGDDG